MNRTYFQTRKLELTLSNYASNIQEASYAENESEKESTYSS